MFHFDFGGGHNDDKNDDKNDDDDANNDDNNNYNNDSDDDDVNSVQQNRRRNNASNQSLTALGNSQFSLDFNDVMMSEQRLPEQQRKVASTSSMLTAEECDDCDSAALVDEDLDQDDIPLHVSTSPQAQQQLLTDIAADCHRSGGIGPEFSTPDEIIVVPISCFNGTTTATTTNYINTNNRLATITQPTQQGGASTTTSIPSNIAPTHPTAQPRVGKSDFELLRVVGKGAYGKVFLVRKITGADKGTFYAMKVLRKAHIVLHSKDKEHTRTERNVLESLRHPFIVRLYYAFQTDAKLYLILLYASGGELFTYLDRQKMFLEDTAKFYIAELVLALDHLHSIGVIYRDLKPENVLLDREGHVLLTDFGLSKVALNGSTTNTICGTVEYMAPEVVANQPYDKTVDWWSLGALAYDMMTGGPPFTSNNRKKTIDLIMNKKLTLPNYLSLDARDILTRLLRKRPNARLGFGETGGVQVKSDRFFRPISWQALLSRQWEPPIKPAVNAPEDVSNFHEAFTSMEVVDSPPTSFKGGAAIPIAANNAATAAGFTDTGGAGRNAGGGRAMSRRYHDSTDDEDDPTLFRGFSFVAKSVIDEHMTAFRSHSSSDSAAAAANTLRSAVQSDLDLDHTTIQQQSTPARRRLMRDFKRLQKDPPMGVSGAPCADNIMMWNAVIFGPSETPFEDGTFKLALDFDETYPNKPPQVRFVSKMFHPNVYQDGKLCLDILQNRWSPTYDVAAILTSIQSLLHDPNPNSPANAEAASLYNENRKEYIRRVREIVEQSWME